MLNKQFQEQIEKAHEQIDDIRTKLESMQKEGRFEKSWSTKSTPKDEGDQVEASDGEPYQRRANYDYNKRVSDCMLNSWWFLTNNFLILFVHVHRLISCHLDVTITR